MTGEPATTTVGSDADAWPIWHCPACQRPNDKLRHTCRYCATFRPCEHHANGRRCGNTPVGMYPVGPKCADHAPPGAPPPRTARTQPTRPSTADRLWAASQLGIPITQLGQCTCGTHHHRYGDGGGPLCPACTGRLRGRR